MDDRLRLLFIAGAKHKTPGALADQVITKVPEPLAAEGKLKPVLSPLTAIQFNLCPNKTLASVR